MTKEPKFKVGDWLRVPKHKHIFQFTSTFKEDDIEFIADGYDEIYGQQGWTIDEVELWKPNVGEWCWFSGGCYGIPTVLKFLKQNSDTRYYGYLHDKFDLKVFSHCEPFIGELPSFIKD